MCLSGRPIEELLTGKLVFFAVNDAPIFLRSSATAANVEEIRKANELCMVDGMTTNPIVPAFAGSLILLMALWAIPVARADADIYRYVDSEGVIHFSNVPSDSRYTIFIRSVKKEAKQYISDYEEFINLASNKFGVDCSLIKAVIKAESDFNHRAVSNKGAQGLMQLMPQTSQALHVSDPFDPEANIIGGTRYLSSLLKRFKGNVRLALAAYNAGPERVDSCQDVPPFEETRDFVERVLKYAGGYELQD
jgi:soluble lytic murein transglycosylase